MVTRRRMSYVVLLLALSFGAAPTAFAVSPRSQTQAAHDRLAASLGKYQHGPLFARYPVTSGRTASSAKGTHTVRPRAGLSLLKANTGFLTAPQISVGGNPVAVATADINGDSKADVAAIVVDPQGGTYSISILQGNGDGSFQQPVLTAVSFDTDSRLYTADVNHDGKDDVLLFHSGTFDVFVSHGDGTFASPLNFLYTLQSGQIPAGVSLTDIDGDGKIDAVVAHGSTGNVSVVLGNGDGTFQLSREDSVPGQLANVVLADMNGDGKLDLVGSSQVFMADPLGGYQAGTSLIVLDGNPSTCSEVDGTVTVADVNNDGKPDIIVAGCETNTVLLFMGDGDGTFQLATIVWAGFDPSAVAAADVNGDGNTDIICANTDGFDITVLLGNGDGTFQTLLAGYAVGGLPGPKPVLADFNGDGHTDIIAPQSVTDYEAGVTYLQGFGDGTFAAADDYFQQLTTGNAFGIGLASADFNNDGIPDLVAGNGATGVDIGVTVLIANSDGTLQPGVNYGTGSNLNFVATGDFDGDGNQDIVAIDAATGDVDLFLGIGDGSFQTAQTFSAGGGVSSGITVGDFNKDGLLDVAMAGSSSRIFVLLNNGAGGFQAAVPYALSADGWEITTADLNSDGNLDLVLTLGGSNSASILLGNGDGTFQAASDFNLGSSFPAGVAVGDLNGDGQPDLAVAIDDFNTGMGIGVALGNGDGSFQPITLYTPSIQPAGNLESYPGEVRVVDLDRDGKLDLIYTNLQFGTVGVMYGNGDGTFVAPVEFPAGMEGYSLVVTDVNGDGALDVVTGEDGFPGVTVLTNKGGVKSTLVSSLNPAAFGQLVVLTSTLATIRGVTAAPTGTVSFMEGPTLLGSGTVSAGQVSLSISTLSQGSHTLSAVYSGDATFLPSTSNSLVQIVGAPLPDYSLSATPPSAFIEAGQSMTFEITATPSNGFTSTVDFSCGSLPAGLSCQFTPSSATLANGQAVNVQLMVTTLPGVAMAAPSRSVSNPWLPLWASFSGVFGWVLIEGLGTRRRRQIALAMLAMMLVMLLSLTGCGGTSPSPAPHVTIASQTVEVMAIAHDAASTSHQLDIDVSISNSAR